MVISVKPKDQCLGELQRKTRKNNEAEPLDGGTQLGQRAIIYELLDLRRRSTVAVKR